MRDVEHKLLAELAAAERHYGRHAVADAIEWALEAAELNRAIQRAATELPEGWELSVVVERHAGWVDLHDDEGEKCVVQDDDLPMAGKVNAAVDAAVARGATR